MYTCTYTYNNAIRKGAFSNLIDVLHTWMYTCVHILKLYMSYRNRVSAQKKLSYHIILYPTIIKLKIIGKMSTHKNSFKLITSNIIKVTTVTKCSMYCELLFTCIFYMQTFRMEGKGEIRYNYYQSGFGKNIQFICYTRRGIKIRESME